MGTLFHDSSLLEHDNIIRVSNRGETVSDHERGPPLDKAAERLVDQLFVDGIEVRGGLVKDKDRRILEQCSRDGESLPLPSRKLDPALTDKGVIGMRKLAYEIMRVRAPGGLLDLFIRWLVGGPGAGSREWSY